MQIRAAVESDFAQVLLLNKESEHFLSPLNLARLRWLHSMAAYHRVLGSDGQVDAFLIALREGCAYDSVNYRWFAERYPRFLYIDRIVVAARRQGNGTGRHLYTDLIGFARAGGALLVTCEIDADPPNEPSQRFHAAFGFKVVGSQLAGVSQKRVSLQAVALESAAAG
ncbi:MAG: GNAT family N-acetyltransferase [Rhodoferax sp.]|nr:GNAT family N-acetyltransferase [Rhodoferax sp.]